MQRIKVLLVHAKDETSQTLQELLQVHHDLSAKHASEVSELKNAKSKLPQVHPPLVATIPGSFAYPHFQNTEGFHDVLRKFIKAIDDEF
ncbi:hypothetical protein Ciccas_011645 [Cichlidogyrus casuarinus]|uniref:Uncharacterized protein n=1 Tax=Cichlidogyrus casuarinus TaxID=1844966 RepID=A0ABD2PSD0_9PLAT